MRIRSLLIALLTLLTLSLLGGLYFWYESKKTIEIGDALSITLHQGFSAQISQITRQQRFALDATGRSIGVDMRSRLGDGEILTLTSSGAIPNLSLFITHFPSAQGAALRLAEDRLLFSRPLPLSVQKVLPKGFRATYLKEFQVCNLVVTSYQPPVDSSLMPQVESLVRALKNSCNGPLNSL
jgi:hypothetical protein